MRTLDISFQSCGIALTSTHPNLNECLRTTKGKCYMLTHRMVLFCEIGFVLWSLYIYFYIYNFSLLILVFLQFIQLVYHDSCMFHVHFDSVLNSSLPIKFERRFSSPLLMPALIDSVWVLLNKNVLSLIMCQKIVQFL